MLATRWLPITVGVTGMIAELLAGNAQATCWAGIFTLSVLVYQKIIDDLEDYIGGVNELLGKALQELQKERK